MAITVIMQDSRPDGAGGTYKKGSTYSLPDTLATYFIDIGLAKRTSTRSEQTGLQITGDSAGRFPSAPAQDAEETLKVRRNSGGGNGVVGEKINIPAGFQFDFSKLKGPLLIALAPDGSIQWHYDYKAHIPQDCRNAPLTQIFHVAPGGADGKTGIGTYLGDFSQAKASLSATITAGNATGLPYQVVVAPGTYLRAKTIQGIVPTADVLIRGYGKDRPVLLMADDLAWSLDTTYPSLYKASRTSVIWALDLKKRRADGSYEPFVKFATAAAAQSSTGVNAFFYDNTTVYVKRADGAVPTISNTAATMAVQCFDSGATTGDVYLENLTFIGGFNNFRRATTKTMVAVDCDFFNMGGYAYVANATSVLDIDFFIAVRCNGSGASSDSFNAHAANGKIPHMLTLDCVGYSNGDGTIGSCNGWTIHDGVPGIDINGRYGMSQGGQVVPVNAGTQALCIGTLAEYPLPTGASAPYAYLSADNAKMWLVSTRTVGAESDLVASTNGLLYVRGHRSEGCRVERMATTGGAVIDF